MANQITDNRTIVAQGNSTSSDNGGNWTALSSTSPTLDTDVKIEGSGSIAEQATNSVRTLIWDAGSNQNWANNVFYIWVNCGVVGLLATKANQGFTIRFTGASASDFYEYDVGGSDEWPIAVEGGWVQFVVDLAATESRQGGTPPAKTAIRGVGIAFQTTAMTKVADNTWIDEIRRLPDGSPGIIVEGRNGGSTDWNFADIVTQLGSSAGTFKNGPGGTFMCNTSIQFGINDTTTHGFTDTNKTIIFEDQEWAPSDLYKLSALGNSGGTTNVTLGVKTGTGDDATGAQGCTFLAASTGVRYDMDFNDPDLDTIGLYGCTFQHGGAFLLDDPAVSCISCAYIDCTSALVSNSEQLRCSVIDANTANDDPFMTTDDIGDIVFCSFEFSDGHGVGLTTPRVASQTSKGNRFSGYGATGTADAAIENDTGGAVTLSLTSGALVSEHTYQNGTGASTTVTGAVSITVKPIVVGSEVRAYRVSDGVEVDGVESSAGTSQALTLVSGQAVNIVVHSYSPPREPIRIENVSFSADQDLIVSQRLDRNFRD